MQFDLLMDIIKEYETYAKVETRNKSKADFGIWLNEKSMLKGIPTNADHKDILGKNEIDVEICKLVIFMNRYAKILIKKGMQHTPELVSEDFTYLYTLMSAESMTKMQLIEKNVHEKPSGMEVIKRLLKQGLIGEKRDIGDKRSKRVFVTTKGKKTFYKSALQMEKVSKIVVGELDENEKKQLYSLLMKLEEYHNPIYLNERNKQLEDLLKRNKTYTDKLDK